MNSKIIESCKQANIVKFNKILKNIRDEKQKNNLKKLFESHMEQIADLCVNDFVKKDLLTEDFIKKLHKIHYPEGFKEFKKAENGIGEVAFMVPGNYKTIANFKRVLPKNVKSEMKKMVNDYNLNINSVNDKFIFINQFVIDFFRIHPFGNGNGTTISILFDLLLIKNNLEPVYLKGYYDRKKEKIYDAIKNSIENNDIKYFINTVKNLKKD